MKNSDFLSYFNNLIETNSNEIIVQNAKNIISTISSSLKTPSNQEELKSIQKYQNFNKIFSSPTEELLYTTRRLIGGLSSTAIELRKGFSLAFHLLLDNFSNDINYNELIESIKKETNIPKNESKHIKLCGSIGKILMFKIILNQKNIKEDNIINIFKQMVILIKLQKTLEESILMLFKNGLDNIFIDYYNFKKEKIFEELTKIFEQLCENKNNLNKINNIIEFSLYFILLKYSDKIKFLSNNLIKELFNIEEDEIKSPLMNYFNLLLKEPIKIINKKKNNNEGELHISFNFLLELLKHLNDIKYVYKIWNILIDPECIKKFKETSSKNFELLVFNYSIFILNNYFNIEYVSQIFDDSFFISLLQFSINRKNKYANIISDLILKKINELDNNNNNKIVNEYLLKLLNIFSHDKFSPNILKNFFVFCFSHLSNENKLKYINSLIKINESEEIFIEEIIFNLSALKNIYLDEKLLNNSEEIKEKILEYFLIQFYSYNNNIDIYYDNFIDEKTFLLILSEIKPIKINNELVQIKSSKAIKILINLHKKIQKLIKNKKIEIDNIENYNKIFKKIIKIESNLKNKDENEIKIKNILKLNLIILINILKNENDYLQEAEDLILIIEKKFDKDWMKVYTDLVLNLLKKTNSVLDEFILNEYKKMSKFIGKEGIEVLIEFLKDRKIYKDKNKYEDDAETVEEEEENEKMEIENE